MVSQGDVSVVSLDVFDTTLWRTVPRPTDAFVLLGEQLRTDGLIAPWVDPYAFRRLRIVAEAQARTAKEAAGEGNECTLDEIWAMFPDALLPDPARWRMAERELDLERRITQPDLDIVDFAVFAKEHGCSLVVVSNTYFSGAQIVRLLARPELEVLRDIQVFASSSYGVNKATGLWKVVLDQLDVAASKVVHVGDEALSDVEVPRQHGIHAVHYRRLVDAVAPVLAREGALVPEPSSPSPVVVNRWVGDLGITGIRAKVAARRGDGELPGDLAVAWQYGATVLGPVLTGFAEWAHGWAEEVGSPTVWCMMREGEFLADLINRVAAHRASDIEARPIWLSRHVTGRATLSEADDRELRPLAVRRLAPTVGQFLLNLGLSQGEVPEFRGSESRRMDRPEVVDEVLGVLTSSDHLRTRILDESRQARRRLVAYMRATMGEQGGPVVLADLGWGGTIQYQLATVMKLAGISDRLVGLYLATNDGATPRILEGSEIVGYLTSCGTPDWAVQQISRTPEVIEQACLATAGSVLDFDDDGRPVLDSSIPPAEQVVSKLVTQHGAHMFQQEWLRYQGAVGGWPVFDGGERPLLLEILRTSISNPTPEEARAFGSWSHEDNFGTQHGDEIVPERLGAFVPYLSPPDLLDMTTQDVYWPLGLAAQYDSGLAAATAAVLSGGMPREAFEPSRGRTRARLWIDWGLGFGEPAEKPVRVNRNGLSYLRFAADHPGITALRFDPCDCPAIFRIDWIDLTMKVVGWREPQRLRLEGEEDLAGLVYSNCRWLYDGVAFGFSSDPQIHIPLAGQAGGSVYGVDVQVAMSVMALPTPSRAVSLGPEVAGGRLTWALARARSEAAQGGLGAVGKGAWRLARRTIGG